MHHICIASAIFRLSWACIQLELIFFHSVFQFCEKAVDLDPAMHAYCALLNKCLLLCHKHADNLKLNEIDWFIEQNFTIALDVAR